MTFADHYGNLVAKIMSRESEFQMNKRTRSGINFLPEGYSFSINLSDNMLPTCGLRRTKPTIAAAETAWCFMGSTSVGWLNLHTKIWEPFSDDNGEVKEAYGYRWKYSFRVDQIQLAVERLRKDSTDRRVWITSYHPCDLVDTGQKTVPCPVGFTLSTYGNRLNSSLMIRSSDVLIGLPLDVMRHAFVMRAIASSIHLSMKLGHMRVTLAHPHVYEHHFEVADEMLRQDVKTPNIKMPDWNVNFIADHPDEYVNLVRERCYVVTAEDLWPSYNPRVEVVK